ncbi:hypothetical protein gpAD87_28180 [Paenibacillus sp. AD87]|nr:hypothetical protein gpAD87_28180 [Paenibacillus sp. AD87]
MVGSCYVKVVVCPQLRPRSRPIAGLLDGRSTTRGRSLLRLAREGRHCLWLGSRVHDFQMLFYKPFNQFQLFYQYRPDFTFSTCLIIGRYH